MPYIMVKITDRANTTGYLPDLVVDGTDILREFLAEKLGIVPDERGDYFLSMDEYQAAYYRVCGEKVYRDLISDRKTDYDRIYDTLDALNEQMSKEEISSPYLRLASAAVALALAAWAGPCDGAGCELADVADDLRNELDACGLVGRC